MKSIIITGASSGIGHATAEVFLNAGWRVGLIARRAKLLDEIASKFEHAHALPCDVTDVVAMKAKFGAFVERSGRLDALFNNAGMFGPSGPIDEVSLEDRKSVV